MAQPRSSAHELRRELLHLHPSLQLDVHDILHAYKILLCNVQALLDGFDAKHAGVVLICDFILPRPEPATTQDVVCAEHGERNVKGIIASELSKIYTVNSIIKLVDHSVMR
jgi:hypothetical protein